MIKRIYRGLCISLCLVLLSSYTVFGQNNKQEELFEENYIDRGSSYTYVDLGTVTQEFSSDEVIASVSILAKVICQGASLPIKIARKIADGLFKEIEGYREDTLYYTSEVHTTQVFLDGEFVYYIIETETWVYSDSDRTDLIARESHTGESLSPASILTQYI